MIALDLSFLPKDTTFWLVVAGCLAVVIILAIVFGRGLNIGPFKVDSAAEKPRGKISVGKGLEGEGVTIGGDVIGLKIPTGGNATNDPDVEVLDEAKLKNTSIRGDVAGIRRQDQPPRK